MHKDLKKREQGILKVLLITLMLNLLVAFGKLWVGHHFFFLSLISSGFDSIFDASSNILGFLAIRLAYRPADKDHLYGHRKYENLGSLIISGLLIYTAFEIGQDIWQSIIHQTKPQPNFLTLVTAIITLLISRFVSVYEKKKGEEYASSMLLADAEHTSADYLVGLGVVGSIICAYLGLFWVDWIISTIICFYLVFMALKIVGQNLPDLLDASPVLNLPLHDLVKEIPGILDCHKFRARGNQKSMYIDFHILVDENLAVREAHQLAHQAEDRIRDFLKEQIRELDITIHIEPYEKEHYD